MALIAYKKVRERLTYFYTLSVFYSPDSLYLPFYNGPGEGSRTLD